MNQARSGSPRSVHLRAFAFACGSIALAAFGQDPYQRLENAADPQTQAYFRDQSATTRATLDRIAGRASLRQRIGELSASQTLIADLALGGTRIFYVKLEPGAPAAQLCMREGPGGAERVLLNPAQFGGDGGAASIAWIAPSPDGRLVAFGVARGASTSTTLHVLGIDGARVEPIEIDRVPRNATIAWEADGRAFYYPRVGEGIRTYRHAVGRATDRDEIVFAPGVGGALGVPEGSVAAFVVPADSRYAYALARPLLAREAAVYSTEQRELAAGKPRWRKIAAPEDGILAVEAWKDELWLLSKRNSPRHRVLRVKAGATSLEGAKVAVAEGDSVIRAMALARDGLYLHTMVAGVDRLERLPLGLFADNKPQFVRIPFDVAITTMAAQPRVEGTVLHLEGWIEPPSLVQVDRHGDAHKLALLPASKVDTSQVDEVRLYAPSTNGAKIPVTLFYRKSTRLSRDNPTLLVAYGSFGVPLMPTFDAARMAWIERGGVFAVAHLRGGGEYGETWHEAGRGASKANTVADLVAVGEFLGTYGFTGSRRLAVMGTGEGALPVALAVERRPDLFAAAVLRTPLADLTRALEGPAREGLAAEFGSDAALSPLHQVRDSLPFPAALLSVGVDGASIPAWHAAKLASRLQAASSSARPVLLRTNDVARPERAEREEELADLFAFLLWQLGDPQFQGPPQSSALPAVS